MVAAVRRLPAYGLLPAYAPGWGEPVLIEDLPGYVRGWMAAPLEGAGVGRGVLLRVVPAWAPRLGAYFHCTDAATDVLRCRLNATVRREAAAQIAPLSQVLLALGHELYALARPALGWVDDWRVRANTPGPVLRERRLQSVHWATWFGPPFVERYGRAFLLGIPGYKAETLADGGVFHQLTATYLVDDPDEAQALRNEVERYFAAAGHQVSSRAPHVAHQIFRSPNSTLRPPWTTPRE